VGPGGRLAFCAFVVFLANGALLVLQLVSARLLAPFIGSTLETWTAVIGAIMAGICLGNAAGGKLADARARAGTLRAVLAAGAAAVLGTLALALVLERTTAWRALSLTPRTAVLALAACFPPAFALSLLTPLAIRLALPDVHRTGRVVGLVYALGTLGSLAGNFLTGFVLLEHATTHTIVGGVALLLCALVLAAPRWEGAAEAGEAAPQAGPRTAPPLSVTSACAIAVVASFCSMCLEMSASRVLAPPLGVSLYSWTGIIGVVLAGIAAGNWLGGVIADRMPKVHVLALSLLAASLATLLVFYMNDALTQLPWQEDLPVIPRTLLWSTLLFLPAMIALGTISPQVIRLAVPDVAHAGSVAGHIYAWSCVGAILGTVATGWWLIKLFGVLKVMFGCAVALALLAVVVGRIWRRPGQLVACTLVVGLAAGALLVRQRLGPFALLETNYFSIYIQIEPAADGSTIRSLILDKLVHSMVRGWVVEEGGQKFFRADPSFLGYWYERVQAEFAVLAANAKDPRILVIGGGGYMLPRWIDRFLKEARCDVVEIDPGVTEVAHRFLGLPTDVRFTKNHMDGRQYVQEVARPGEYDLVVQDVVNDWQVPFHLMTREYFAAARSILKPGGVLLVSVIDTWKTGRLYRAAVRTLQQSFRHVHITAAKPVWETQERSVMIIYASDRPLDLAANRQLFAQRGIPTMLTVMLPPDRQAALVDALPEVILTDTYAPVDNLIKVHGVSGKEPVPR
jgi:MFS family permease/SAM-dependent methyltransferase